MMDVVCNLDAFVLQIKPTKLFFIPIFSVSKDLYKIVTTIYYST